MSFYVKDPATDKAVRKLAKLKGKTLTEAIRDAVEKELQAQEKKTRHERILVHLSNIIANQGALPIKIGDETIGAAGASGAPGGEKDELCIKTAIDKVADQLK